MKRNSGQRILIHRDKILSLSKEICIFWTHTNFSRGGIPGERLGICRPQHQSLPAWVSFPPYHQYQYKSGSKPVVFPASVRSFCCFQEALSQAVLCHISSIEVWQNWPLVPSENICRVMALKLCLAPCLDGQGQNTPSSVLGEMGTPAWTGWLFIPQAFAEWS